jgi:hypothetical protein
MNTEQFEKMGAAEKRAALKDLIALVRPRVASPNSNSFNLLPIQKAYYSGKALSSSTGRSNAHIYIEFEIPEFSENSFTNSWNKLLEKHEALRLRINAEGRQFIVDKNEFKSGSLELKDMSDMADAFSISIMDSWRAELSRKFYPVDSSCFFTIRVAVLPDKRAIVFFSIDELLIDGFSLQLLMKQWKRLYHNTSAELESTGLNYQRYVEFLHDRSVALARSEQWKFWDKYALYPSPGKNMTQSAMPPLLPKTDRHGFIMDTSEWTALKSTANALGCSSTSLVLFIYCQSLQKFFNRDKFSLLLTVFDRMHEDRSVDDLIGPFVSTAFFSYVHQPYRPTREQIKDFAQNFYGVLENAEVSGIEVLQRKKRQRELNSQYKCSFVFTSMLGATGLSDQEDSWLREMRYSVSQTPQVDCDHQLHQLDGALHLTFDVVTAAFDTGEFQDFMIEYRNALLAALRSVDSNPDIAPEVHAFHVVDKSTTEFEQLVVSGYKEEMARSAGQADGGPHLLTALQRSYIVSKMLDNRSILAYQEFLVPEMDVTRLYLVIQKVILAHDMLRCILDAASNGLVLNYCPVFDIEEKEVNRPFDDQDPILKQRRETLRSTFFDYQHWPLFSVALTSFNDGQSIVHFCVDGLIGDMISLKQLYTEVFRLYFGDSDKLLFSVDDGKYRRYRSAMAAIAMSTAGESARSYWKKKFADLLSEDYTRLQQPLPCSSGHIRYTTTIGEWDQIVSICRQNGIRPDAVLFFAYALSLEGLVDTGSVPVLFVSADRPKLCPNVEEWIGDFTRLAWFTYSRPTTTTVLLDELRTCQHRLSTDLDNWVVDGLEMLKTMQLKLHKSLVFPFVYTRLVEQSHDCFPATVTVLNGETQTPGVLIDCMGISSGKTLNISWDVLDSQLFGRSVELFFKKFEQTVSAMRNTSVWQAGTDELIRHVSK